MDVSQVVRTARAEGERMRAAIAGAQPDAKVNMDVHQFARLAEFLLLLCDVASATGGPDNPGGRAKEGRMKRSRSMQGIHTLAQLEAEMTTAELAFAEAEERLQQAQQDRDTALATINRHQAEIDGVIAQLRKRSPPQSSWQGVGENTAGVLMLEQEDSAEAEAALILTDDAVVTADPAAPAGAAERPAKVRTG